MNIKTLKIDLIYTNSIDQFYKWKAIEIVAIINEMKNKFVKLCLTRLIIVGSAI